VTPRPSQREAIMSAALACFARNGYDATRIRDISQAAGVSDGALYRHFTSKEVLGRELHMQAISTLTAELAAREQAESPADALREIAFRVLALYRERPDAFVFALVQAPPSAAGSMPADPDLPVDVLARIIKRGQVSGDVRAGNPRVLAASFLGCLLQPIALSLSAPGCVHDVLGDNTADDTIVEAALGSLGIDK
jgi:AcrR family transcriptional regulator